MRRPVLLVYRPLGLGDLLTAVPALRALADAWPEHLHLLAAPRWLAPLAVHSRAVDAVVHSLPLRPLSRDGARPDVAVNLHGRGPESHRVLLATRPRKMIAFACPSIAGSEAWPRWRADEHEVTRWCRLLDESGVPADPARLELEPPERALPPAAVGATIVAPGAGAPARRWPVERWAAVARHSAARGSTVLITGSRPERGLAEEVARRAGLPPGAVLAGRTDVLQLATYVARAARVVSGDTGVAHLATAFGTPSVVLFGPTPPARWGPPSDRLQHRVLWAGREGDPHGAAIDPGLRSIAVTDVVEALESLPEHCMGGLQ
jgi:ADP-heptose:LPS heptosyltransferase